MRLLIALYLVAVVFWLLLPVLAFGLGFWPYILGLMTLIAAGFLLDSLRQRHLLKCPACQAGISHKEMEEMEQRVWQRILARTGKGG